MKGGGFCPFTLFPTMYGRNIIIREYVQFRGFFNAMRAWKRGITCMALYEKRDNFTWKRGGGCTFPFQFSPFTAKISIFTNVINFIFYSTRRDRQNEELHGRQYKSTCCRVIGHLATHFSGYTNALRYH